MKNCSHLVPPFSTQITAAFTSNDYSTFFVVRFFFRVAIHLLEAAVGCVVQQVLF